MLIYVIFRKVTTRINLTEEQQQKSPPALMVSTLSCLENGREKFLQELLMGSQIHSFLSYSSNDFVKYSWGFFFHLSLFFF